MPQVILNINGNSYTMQCNDGEEDHLRELGLVLDAEVGKIRSAVGQVGDIRLLLMSGLVIADRLSETVQKVEELEDQVKQLRHSNALPVAQNGQISEDVTVRLDAAADRIEALTRELAN